MIAGASFFKRSGQYNRANYGNDYSGNYFNYHSKFMTISSSAEDPLHGDHQESDHEYVLKLGFDENIEQIHYSFSKFQFANYVLNLFFIYFGASLSGLFSLLASTRMRKLNSMKLLFILVVVYVEFRQMIDQFSERKLLYNTEFDTADSANIPKTTICYPIMEILKNGWENEFPLNDGQKGKKYFSFLNNRTKNDIDSRTKNLTELFYNITFLGKFNHIESIFTDFRNLKYQFNSSQRFRRLRHANRSNAELARTSWQVQCTHSG